MSFKIFILRLTGKIRDTEKIEAERRTIEKNFNAFLDAELSEELKKFREYDGWIKSGDYNRKKKEVKALIFKGSNEHNLLREFEGLGKKSQIKDYFKVLNSGELPRFRNLEGSETLKNYRELKSWAEEGKFDQEKQEILKQKYEGSPEHQKLRELEQISRNKMLKAFLKLNGSEALKKHLQFREDAKFRRFSELKNMTAKDKTSLKEFKKLKKDSDIRAFFKFENSKENKYFSEMKGSPLPARYDALIRETGSENFRQKVTYMKDGKKLEKSETWKKYLRFRDLARSEDILFYLKYGKSALYRNFLDMGDSRQLKRYIELKALTASPPFLERKAYLEDNKKWEKTDEYVQYQEYLKLKKNPKIDTYFRFVDSHDFDFLKQWEVSFADDFEGSALDRDKWMPNTYWADRFPGGNYSQPGDLQAYAGGKNCVIRESKLSIVTRKESVQGKRWQADLGFVPVDFNYTSETLSTAKSFWQKEGIFEAKIRFNPVKEVVQSCHLLGESVTPQVTLVEAGPRSRSGLLFFDETRKPQFTGVDLRNLKTGRFYIFRVEWDKNHFIWKINDRQIFEMQVPDIKNQVHINLSCLVISDINNSKLPVSFDTDWIRCYRKK